MKHSSTWFALILIASALFQSAAQNLNADSPSPRPTQQPNKTSALSDYQSAQQVTPVSTPNISQSPPDTGAPNKKENNGSDTATKVIAFFTVVAGFATAAIALFNYQLVGVTEEMKKATAEAAEAAKQSAKAAELVLNTERPYVFLEGQQIAVTLCLSGFANMLEHPVPIDVSADPLAHKGVDPRDAANLHLEFDLRNRGKGVAVIRNVYIRMLVGKGLDKETNVRLWTAGRCDGEIGYGVKVLGLGDTARAFSSGLQLNLDLLGSIKAWGASLGFVVLVSYEDVYKRRYSTTFPFEYRAPVITFQSKLLSGPSCCQPSKCAVVGTDDLRLKHRPVTQNMPTRHWSVRST
jgi:hypothetical protein